MFLLIGSDWPRGNVPGAEPHLVVAPGDGQDVPGDGPADVPHHVAELVQKLGCPGVSCGVVTGPDKHPPVLGREGRNETSHLPTPRFLPGQQSTRVLTSKPHHLGR